ncbi:MAG: hypothetical protein KIT72_13785 [Polyangiaceae bacterium]|nr:hypothetical protein [Polyangiaceae bacterium]MCW5791482.1 hypothetical protein [Polyangiaceae bacterium]
MSRSRSFAALGVLALGVSLAHPSSAQEVTITDSCRRHFSAGVAFMREPDGARDEDAYREFKAAYNECPSWKILGNLGEAARRLERDGEALEALVRYLDEGKDNVDIAEREQYQRDIPVLKASVAWVTLKIGQPGAMVTDIRTDSRGKQIHNRYRALDPELKIGVRPGVHQITVSVQGYEPAVWEFEAASGATLEHRFELVKPKGGGSPDGPSVPGVDPGTGDASPGGEGERPIPATVFISGGVAALGFIGFAVLGSMASGKRSDFDAKNDGSDPAGAKSLKDSGESLNLFADVSLGVGVIAGALTAVFYLTRPEVSPAQDRGLKLTPQVGPDVAGLSLFKRF